MKRFLKTSKGTIHFPHFFPVTTFGTKYPLDEILRPFLPRFAQGLMVSYHYAQQMREPPKLPLFIDSGGFAGLFQGANFVEIGHEVGIQKPDGELLTPKAVLEFQQKCGQIGATLDCLIPPDLEENKRNRDDLDWL